MSLDHIIVRLFLPEEWQVYKAIRLKALQSDPYVFSSSYEAESFHPDQRWKDGVTDANVGIFGVFHEGNIIGMTGVAVDKYDPTGVTAELWGSWIEKEWRNKGLSKKMYKARIEWTEQRPELTSIVMGHREGNLASMKAGQKYGFLFSHKEDQTWPDGTADLCCIYTLRLQ